MGQIRNVANELASVNPRAVAGDLSRGVLLRVGRASGGGATAAMSGSLQGRARGILLFETVRWLTPLTRLAQEDATNPPDGHRYRFSARTPPPEQRRGF